MVAQTRMVEGEAVTPAVKQTAGRTRAIVAATLGSMMEWYDFVTFAYLAAYISKVFFPDANETTALLATFATFGAGYLARPLGGVLFGVLGDHKGRKRVLTVTMLLMAVATVGIAVLPGYESVGIAAPIALIFARLAQGLSAGGEATTAMIYAFEWAPEGRRGVFGSLQVAGSGFGLLLGSATVTILLFVLSKEEMASWGWRIPFLLGGIVIGPIGFWIRRSMAESPEFEASSSANGTAKPRMFRAEHLPAGLRLFFLNSTWSILYYVFLSFMPTFAQRNLNIDSLSAFSINTLSLAVYISLIPAFGALSDRVGRKPVLFASCAGFAALTYPLFNHLVSGAPISHYIAIICCFAILLAMFSGAAVATFAELFPAYDRSKWFSSVYGLSAAIFGGFTPYVATWLVKSFDSPIAPAAYVIAGAVMGLLTVLSLRETAMATRAEGSSDAHGDRFDDAALTASSGTTKRSF